MGKKSKKPLNGDMKILKCANELLKALTEQGYCVKSQGDYGNVNIWVHGIGSYNRVIVENEINIKKGWRVRGKLTAPLISGQKTANETI